MTTILIDCDNQEVHSDTRATISYEDMDTTSEEDVEKIHELPDGTVIVGAGSRKMIAEFIKVYPNVPRVYSKGNPHTSICVIRPAKEGLWVKQFGFKYGKTSCSFLDWYLRNIPKKAYVAELSSNQIHSSGCVTLGSGGVIAKVLFEEGYGIQEIYDIVSKHDVGTNNKITTLEVKLDED